MRGLLRKDFYVTRKTAAMYFGIVLFFCLLPSVWYLSVSYAMVQAYMLSISIMYMDVYSGWDRFTAMLPYRIEEIVLSKYLILAFYTLPPAASLLLRDLVQAVREPGSVNWLYSGCTVLLLFESMLLAVAVTIPVFYRYGANKGRVIIVAVLLACMIGGQSVIYYTWKYGPLSLVLPFVTVPPFLTAVLCAVLVCAALALSYRLSVSFYRNRRYGAYDA
ncbi:MAG: ABC-2 transporter permease [Oscillospiraceae bacterium]|nr:ABC-2 transporter permease [Oscillospiraceae bacterium]